MTQRAKRALTVAAVVCGLLLSVYAYASWVDYGRAKDFCAQLPSGSSLAAARQLAENDNNKHSVQLGDGRLSVTFITLHSCQCDVGFKGETVTYTKAWCTD
jgi:hypothetical protein